MVRPITKTGWPQAPSARVVYGAIKSLDEKRQTLSGCTGQMSTRITAALQANQVSWANLAKAIVFAYQLAALGRESSCCRSPDIWLGLAQIKVRYQKFGCWTVTAALRPQGRLAARYQKFLEVNRAQVSSGFSTDSDGRSDRFVYHSVKCLIEVSLMDVC